jgi:Uma2 family endonuclease
MEAKSKRTRWTYAEFARLPTSGSTRYEVIAGELVMTPSPGSRHQAIVGRLMAWLFTFAESRDLGRVFPGPLDVLFAEGDYLEPDILFVRRDRLHLVSERGVEGPPDLVVEVLSRSTTGRDRGIKLERYRHFGVPEYWVVDPEQNSVEVWKLADDVHRPLVLGQTEALEWTLAAGASLAIDLAALFAD